MFAYRCFALVALALCTLPAAAQMNHATHAGAPAPAPAASALQEGVVRKIDQGAAKISVAHAAQANGMPAMTMVYGVKDAAALAQLTVGQKIRFATSDGMTIVRLESVK